ncbi:MAG: SMC-Scp complex subunit ScpB [Actinomycetota bacterium]
MSEPREVRRVLEAILFVAEEPVPTSDLALVLELPAAQVQRALEAMAASFEEEGRGLALRRVAGGWRLAAHPGAAPYLERFVGGHRSARLTQAALETLSIIAYRQPVSRAQVAEVRGVSCEGVIRTLTARGLVEEVGRDPGPGLAILYGTTLAFLERLGLESLMDLPPLVGFLPGIEEVELMERGLGPGV